MTKLKRPIPKLLHPAPAIITLTPDELRTLCRIQLEKCPHVMALAWAMDPLDWMHVYALVPEGSDRTDFAVAEARIEAAAPGQRLMLHRRERFYPELPMEREFPIGAETYWRRP